MSAFAVNLADSTLRRGCVSRQINGDLLALLAIRSHSLAYGLVAHADYLREGGEDFVRLSVRGFIYSRDGPITDHILGTHCAHPAPTTRYRLQVNRKHLAAL